MYSRVDIQWRMIDDGTCDVERGANRDKTKASSSYKITSIYGQERTGKYE